MADLRIEPDDQESFPTLLKRHLGAIISLVGLAGQVGAVVWFLSDQNAKIEHVVEALQVMQARNVPDRLRVVEDTTANQQREIDELQRQYQELQGGISELNQHFSAIDGKLSFVIDELFPPAGGSRVPRRVP